MYTDALPETTLPRAGGLRRSSAERNRTGNAVAAAARREHVGSRPLERAAPAVPKRRLLRDHLEADGDGDPATGRAADELEAVGGDGVDAVGRQSVDRREAMLLIGAVQAGGAAKRTCSTSRRLDRQRSAVLDGGPGAPARRPSRRGQCKRARGDRDRTTADARAPVASLRAAREVLAAARPTPRPPCRTA